MAEQGGVPNQLFDVMSFRVCDIHAYSTSLCLIMEYKSTTLAVLVNRSI